MTTTLEPTQRKAQHENDGPRHQSENSVLSSDDEDNFDGSQFNSSINGDNEDNDANSNSNSNLNSTGTNTLGTNSNTNSQPNNTTNNGFTAIKASNLSKPAVLQPNSSNQQPSSNTKSNHFNTNSTSDSSMSRPARAGNFGANYGKKYIHWTDRQVELLSTYLKEHVSFATSPCIEACELIKMKVFPNDDDITPKRLFGKICNMRAAYRRSGGVKDEVTDSSGRKRRKRRHFQMDTIYSQFEGQKEPDEVELKKAKRKISSFDYDDYDDDDDNDDEQKMNDIEDGNDGTESVHNNENEKEDKNNGSNDNTTIKAEQTEGSSKPDSRDTSEGVEESLEQRAIDEELLQLSTKKRGRPVNKKWSHFNIHSGASSVNILPSTLNPAQNKRILPAPSSEALAKQYEITRRRNGVPDFIRGDVIPPSIRNGYDYGLLNRLNLEKPASHASLSGLNTHQSTSPFLGFGGGMMLNVSQLDVESIEQEIEAVSKLQQFPTESSRIFDLYPELKEVLSRESAENKASNGTDDSKADKPKDGQVSFDNITGNLTEDLKYLDKVLENKDLDPKIQSSLDLVGNMNKALVQQLRAWEDVSSMSSSVASKSNEPESVDGKKDTVSVAFDLISQKLKMDYLTTRSLVFATSNLLFKDQHETPSESKDYTELYAKATLLNSYTQLLGSRSKAAEMRKDYVTKLSELAKLKTQESVARVEELKLKAAEAEALARHAAISRDEARAHAEESKTKALEAKMMARAWKSRTKIEVQSEKQKLGVSEKGEEEEDDDEEEEGGDDENGDNDKANGGKNTDDAKTEDKAGKTEDADAAAGVSETKAVDASSSAAASDQESEMSGDE